jgi:hypothetical protein
MVYWIALIAFFMIFFLGSLAIMAIFFKGYRFKLLTALAMPFLVFAIDLLFSYPKIDPLWRMFFQ